MEIGSQVDPFPIRGSLPKTSLVAPKLPTDFPLFITSSNDGMVDSVF
jgi:hypothetical protein